MKPTRSNRDSLPDLQRAPNNQGQSRLPPLRGSASVGVVPHAGVQLQEGSPLLLGRRPSDGNLTMGDLPSGQLSSASSAASNVAPLHAEQPSFLSSFRSNGTGVMRRRTDKSERLQPLRAPGIGNSIDAAAAPVWNPQRPLPSALLVPPGAGETASPDRSGSMSKSSSTPSLVAKSNFGASGGHRNPPTFSGSNSLWANTPSPTGAARPQEAAYPSTSSSSSRSPTCGTSQRLGVETVGAKAQRTPQHGIDRMLNSPSQGRPGTAERRSASMPPPAANSSPPNQAARLQAVASLQRFFFEEVGKSGDPNAAAAAALLRLAEESRPTHDDHLPADRRQGDSRSQAPGRSTEPENERSRRRQTPQNREDRLLLMPA